MGACASRFRVLKDAADAPPPASKEEVAARDLNLAEGKVKKDGAPAVPADDEAKPQSLGHFLNEDEGKKGSAENNGEVKQEDATKAKPHENGNVKSPEHVADAPAKDEANKAPATDGLKIRTSKEKKAEDVKPASQNVEPEESQKRTEENPAETTKLETPKTEKPEENKIDENSVMDMKPETLETKKTDEQKPTPDTDKKETDEQLSEITKPETLETKKTEEQKAASDADKKKTEDKPAEITKIETSEKVEDKQVVEPLKIEKDTKPASDAAKPKGGEESTKK